MKIEFKYKSILDMTDLSELPQCVDSSNSNRSYRAKKVRPIRVQAPVVYHNICPKCKTWSYPPEKKFNTRNLCPDCMYKKTCNLCHKSYSSQYEFSSVCNECNDIRDYIQNPSRTKTSPPVYPNLELVVIYEVTKKSHCGWCSDPGNGDTETLYETHVYPLLKLFKKSDIDIDDKSVTNWSLIKKYYKPDDVTNCSRCGTLYSVEKAFVVDNRIVNQLDD